MSELVKRLSTGTHRIICGRARSVSDLKVAVDQGYVLLKFNETNGGTELGVRLDKSRSRLEGADFEAGTGSIQLVGSLVLNYNEVELSAKLDLATLDGEASLRVIRAEMEWRAHRANGDGVGLKSVH